MQIQQQHTGKKSWAFVIGSRPSKWVSTIVKGNVLPITVLDFMRANFDLSKELLGGIPWVRDLVCKGVKESWSLFEHHFLHAQERYISLSKKSNKCGRRPTRISKHLQAELRWKRKLYAMWKEGQATWEEHRNIVRVCREEMRKAKAHLELNLAKDVKDNKKGFFKYSSSKQLVRKNVGPLLNKLGVLVTEDAGKAELLNACFASVFTTKAVPQESQALEVREEACRKDDPPLDEEDCV